MTKNYKFASRTPLADGTPDYAPSILRVPIHHHEEWDETILDPETGEPVIDPETGEPKTEHRTRDWTTYETKLKPMDEDYHACGYIPVITAVPSAPAPQGYHYEACGWSIVDDAFHRIYETVQDPPPPPRRWSRLSIKTALAQSGMLDSVREYLSSIEMASGYSAWDASTDCDYIEEGYPDAEKWNAILDGAARTLGKSRADIDAFLSAIPTEI